MWRRGDRRYAERVMRNPRGKRTAGGSSKTHHASRPPQLRRVLIADDNLAEREMYASYFAAHGIRVFMAGDGVNAVHIAKEMRPDVIVMDLSLPSLNGWEATRRLKHDVRTARIPILRASPAERRSRGTPDVTAKGVIARTLLKGYHWRPPGNEVYLTL